MLLGYGGQTVGKYTENTEDRRLVIDFCHQTVTWVTAEISMAAYVIDGGVTRVTVEISMAAKTVTWVGLVHFYIRGHPSSESADGEQAG